MFSFLSGFQLRAALIGVVLLGAFTAGWKINGWRYEAKIADQLEEQALQRVQFENIYRKLVADLQAERANSLQKYDKLKRSIQDVTDNRVCFTDWDAVRVWNAALAGADGLPKTPTRTTDTAGGAANVTDRAILENQVENARRWKNLRDQVNKLREWDKQTFEDK